MKYVITINQKAIVDGGFHEKTDLADWAIIDYIMAWQLSPKANRYGDMIWLNYKHLMAEMPLLGINTKSSISARITKLKDLSLLESEQLDDGRLYVKTTEIVFNLLQFPDDGIQPPPPVHCGEQGVRLNEQGVRQNEQGVRQNEQGVRQNEQGVRQNEQGVRQNEQGVRLNEHSLIHKNIQLEQTIKTTTTTPSSVVGGGELIFSKVFSKAEREKMAKILEAVAEIDVKQQMLDVLTAAVQDGKVKNKLSYLRGLAKSHANGLFDPLPGFYVAQRRADALAGSQAAGFTDQRQVAELESELKGLIRINNQGLLDGQIASKRQKLAELKASRPV